MNKHLGVYHRRSLRLRGYDYTQAGAYFVTLVAQGRKCLFGDVVDGATQMNEFGIVVMECWNDLQSHYPTVALDAFVVMPNHFHGIIMLNELEPSGETCDESIHQAAPHKDGLRPPVGAGLKPALLSSTKKWQLTEIVRAFKTFSSRRINELRGTQGNRVWQRNYYEHVIRNNRRLEEIREYVTTNPLKWELDQLHPRNPSTW